MAKTWEARKATRSPLIGIVFRDGKSPIKIDCLICFWEEWCLIIGVVYYAWAFSSLSKVLWIQHEGFQRYYSFSICRRLDLLCSFTSIRLNANFCWSLLVFSYVGYALDSRWQLKSDQIICVIAISQRNPITIFQQVCSPSLVPAGVSAILYLAYLLWWWLASCSISSRSMLFLLTRAHRPTLMKTLACHKISHALSWIHCGAAIRPGSIVGPSQFFHMCDASFQPQPLV